MASYTNLKDYYTKDEYRAFLAAKADKLNTFTKNQTYELLGTKQDIIKEDDLSVNMVQGLVDALDSKQNKITDNSIKISEVANLQTSLNAKPNSVNVYSKFF